MPSPDGIQWFIDRLNNTGKKELTVSDIDKAMDEMPDDFVVKKTSLESRRRGEKHDYRIQ